MLPNSFQEVNIILNPNPEALLEVGKRRDLKNIMKEQILKILNKISSTHREDTIS